MDIGVLVMLVFAAVAIWVAATAGLWRQTERTGRTPPPVLPPLADVEFAAELAVPVQQREEDEPDFPVEQPEAQDDLTDIPNGMMPQVRAVTFTPGFALADESVQPGAAEQAGFTVEWSGAGEGDSPTLPAYAAGTDMPDGAAEPTPDGGDLPVTAIPRNPQSLYVSWERPERGEARLQAVLGPDRFGATVPCLRVFDLGSEQQTTVDLGEQEDHWFLQDLNPGRRYVVALERRTPEGTHYLLGVSQPVSTLDTAPPTSAG